MVGDVFWSNMSRFARKMQKLQRIRGEKKKFYPTTFGSRPDIRIPIFAGGENYGFRQNYGKNRIFSKSKKKKKKKKKKK